MSFLDTLKSIELQDLDPDGGVLSLSVSWKPQPEDPLPDFPGQKLFTVLYIPTRPGDLCLCGSGKRFNACCQPLPYWLPLCPDPAMRGYSLLRPQSAVFTNVPDNKVYAFLQDDERLYCDDDTPEDAMWLYWGNPGVKSPHGILCFGDLKLQKDKTLEISALSDTRMKAILDLLDPLKLGTPRIRKEVAQPLEKPVQKDKTPQSKRRRK